MESGIIVYRAEQGEHCKLSLYDSEYVRAIFSLMEGSGPHIVNGRISGSRDEIQKINMALEGILYNTKIGYTERERRINSAFSAYPPSDIHA